MGRRSVAGRPNMELRFGFVDFCKIGIMVPDQQRRESSALRETLWQQRHRSRHYSHQSTKSNNEGSTVNNSPRHVCLRIRKEP
ncbi:hypothetical protein L596_006009 [Steinernema carpocapsae]|uniref:Uncharacterized protein n=1 Tax=Steinernema carpocapsae TaxID=34508 RepID=A0A4U8V0T4_STECR|nr:hypothetical protein L596_006009 [Steinernema carpocapsae]